MHHSQHHDSTGQVITETVYVTVPKQPESQNQRTVWVARDLFEGHVVQSLRSEEGHLRLYQAAQGPVLESFQEWSIYHLWATCSGS